MITAIEVQDLRGVRSGALSALAPLTVLVGRNGAGKSAVLEALAIGATHQPAALVGQVVQARGGWGGAGYLIRGGAGEARLRVQLASGELRTTALRFQSQAADIDQGEVPPEHPPHTPLSSIEVALAVEGGAAPIAGGVTDGFPYTARTLFALNNDFGYRRQPDPRGGARLRLLHPVAVRAHPLWRTLNDAVRSGRDQAVVELLRPALGAELRDLYFMPEGEDGRVGNVHLRYPWGSVPVEVAGDGVRTMVRMALELAARPAEIVLLEEPEVHLHPGAIWAAARVVLEARRRGLQIILSTHSLELIDALIEQAGTEIENLTVLRVALDNGELRSHTIPGPELRLLRGALAEELR